MKRNIVERIHTKWRACIFVNTFELRPWGGYLFFFNVFAQLGIDAIVTKHISYSRMYYRIEEFGPDARTLGFGCVILSLIMLVQYLLQAKGKIIRAVKKKKTTNIVFLFWVSFILFPLYCSNLGNVFVFITITAFVLIGGVISTIVFHNAVCSNA